VVDLPLGIVALGLVQGGLIALGAQALVIAHRHQRAIDLSLPALGAAAGASAGILVTAAGWPFVVAAVCAVAGAAVASALARAAVAPRLQYAPPAVALIATAGIGQVFAAFGSALPFIAGHPAPTYRVDFGVSIGVDRVTLGGGQLLAMVAPVLGLAVFAIWRRTRASLEAEAQSQDPELAATFAVNPRRAAAFGAAVAGVLAATGGVLTVPALGASISAAPAPAVWILFLAPAVLARWRSIPVATIAGVALGVVAQAAQWWTGRAAAGQLVVAAILVVAVAVTRAEPGRAGDVAAASAWRTTVDQSLRRLRSRWAGLVLGVLAVAVVVAASTASVGPARWLGGAAGLAAAATAVALAWMLAGEVFVAAWPLAAIGAVVTAATFATPLGASGALVAAVAVGAALGALCALAGRRGRSAVALVGIALAVAVEAALVTNGAEPPTIEPAGGGAGGVAVACTGVVLLVAALVAVTRSRWGRRAVLVRDDARRAATLGIEPAATRAGALALAGAFAAAAGWLGLVAQPAPVLETFGALRALVPVAMAVAGGLVWSGAGLAGAVVLRAVETAAPGDIAAFGVTGLALLVVLAFAPRPSRAGAVRGGDVDGPSEAALLAARAVYAGHNGHQVLDGVTLESLPGQIVEVRGPNGSGKTTLLRAVAGLHPSTGSVALEGRRVNRIGASGRAGAGIAFVPAERPVFPDLTVAEHCRLARVELTVLRAVGLELRTSALAGTLSGGEQRLLALVLATARRPRLLLADEVFSGLSPARAVVAARLLTELAGKCSAVVVAGHGLPGDLASAAVDLEAPVAHG